MIGKHEITSTLEQDQCRKIIIRQKSTLNEIRPSHGSAMYSLNTLSNDTFTNLSNNSVVKQNAICKSKNFTYDTKYDSTVCFSGMQIGDAKLSEKLELISKQSNESSYQPAVSVASNSSNTFLDQFKKNIYSEKRGAPVEPSLTEKQAELLGASACHDKSNFLYQTSTPLEVYQNAQPWLSELLKSKSYNSKQRKVTPKTNDNSLNKKYDKVIDGQSEMNFGNLNNKNTILDKSQRSIPPNLCKLKALTGHGHSKIISTLQKSPTLKPLSARSMKTSSQGTCRMTSFITSTSLTSNEARNGSTVSQTTEQTDTFEKWVTNLPCSPEFSKPLKPPKLPPLPFIEKMDGIDNSAFGYSGSRFQLMSKPDLKEDNKKPGSESSFPCGVCDKVFSARHQLRRHSVTHSNWRPYQ